MANPQPIPFVQFSKELFDAILRSPMPATQQRIVLAIVRRTYGDGGKKQAEISLGLLVQMLDRDKGTISRALHDLVAHGVVKVVRPAHFRTPQVLALNKDYEAWGDYSVDSATVGPSATVGDESTVGQNLRDSRLKPLATVALEQRNSCAGATIEDKSIQEQTRDKSSMPKRPVVSAPKDVDWQARADDLLGQSNFPNDLLQLGELLAGENKTGKVQLSRIVRQLYEPIVGLQDDLSSDALRYGLRAAISAGVPNWRYVRKAAEGFRPNGSAAAVATNTFDQPRSDFDRDFFTESYRDEVTS